jgi:hypothetical protein
MWNRLSEYDKDCITAGVCLAVFLGVAIFAAVV